MSSDDQRRAEGWGPLIIGAGAAAILVGLFGLAIDAYQWWAKPVPKPTPVAAVNELDDSWVLRRLTECDKVCGPVPFEVDAARDRIVCTCGRPERVRPFRVPKGG